MNLSRKRLVPYALGLALVAALVAFGLYIVRRQFDAILQICLALIVIGLAAAILLDPERARQLLTGRQARYGSNALLMTLAFTGILVVVNVLGFKYAPRWDPTQDQEHTLTKATVDILQSLQQPVTVDAFYTPRTPSSDAQNLLATYQSAGKGKLSYQLIDPEQNPVAAENDKVTRDGTIVFKMGDRQEQISYVSEEDMTTALVKLANPGKRVVYFLAGHGEFDPEATGDSSYSQVKASLGNKNYTVTKLNLLGGSKIPADALAIVIARPKKPLVESEVQALKAYQNQGGSLVVLYDPTLFLDFGSAKDPLADYLASTWGVKFDNDMVVDYNPVAQQMDVAAFASSYGDSPITQKLQNMAAVFPTARTLSTSQVPGVTVTKLVQTSEQSWGETDLANMGKTTASPDPGKDVIGPVTVALTATTDKSKARLVVVGDGDFAEDQYFNTYANSDFMINSIDWAAAQENLINLTPKAPTQRMMLPPKTYTVGLIFFATVFLMPGTVLFSGIFTWMQRRRRG